MRNIALVFGRKNSKGLKNKNIKKILNKPMYSYPIDAAKKVSNIDEIFVSSDNQTILQYGKKKGCHVIKRPKYLCTDKSLLSDAIQHAVSHCFSIYEKIDNFVILLCNSVCFLPKDIKEGLKIINKSKKIETVATISKFNMFSPVRAKKITGTEIKNYIPNNTLSKFTGLSGDRNLSVDTYFCTHSFTITKAKVLKNMKQNDYPFKWMGKKIKFIEQDSCIGDIDFEWQLPVLKWWLKKNNVKK